jgi:para-nitrobenzyl esterase
MNHRDWTLASLFVFVCSPGCGDGSAGHGADPSGGSSMQTEGGASGGEDPSGGTRIQTDKGAVKGTSVGATREFLGIPYAAPPMGALRWKPPQPALPWTGDFDATKRSSACPQFGPSLLPFDLEQREDCLALNVWSPKASPTSKAPVMVWVHGGGFATGSGGESLYNARALSEATGTVVVTLNYRLGALGFLHHDALAGEGASPPSSGNLGLEDQRAAMAWVRDNIAAFGGDPDNVTIFGESAGGASVCLHLASPRSKGLFHRAIIESGSCSLLVQGGLAAEAQGTKFATALGCTDAASTAECLRSKDVNELVKSGDIDKGANAWGPVVDGVELSKPPQKALEAGEFNHVPVLLGSNKDEGTLFAAQTVPGALDEQGYTALVQSLFGAASMTLIAAYPSSAYASPKAALADLVGDQLFVCPTRRVARALSKGGSPTFIYHLEYDLNPPALPGFGVFHGSELPLVFGNAVLGIEFTAEKKQLSRDIMGYWSSFASDGDPNLEGKPSWPAFSADMESHLVLAVPIQTGKDLKKEPCDLWDTLEK